MTHADLRELYHLAISAAQDAGRIHMERLHQPRTVEAKSSPSDAVTEVDRACEELIVSRILTARPDDSIVGEEGTNHTGSSGVTWILDPLDGTVNYVYRRADFSVSIGVEVEGVASVGAVYDSTRDEMFSAIRGQGAWLNGDPIRSSLVTDLGMALTGTGFGYDPLVRRQQGAVVAEVVSQVRDIRRGGSAALELCGVASGRLEAYFERGPHPWDVTGAMPIIREAGGVIEALEPPDVPHQVWLAAGNPQLFEAIRVLVIEATARTAEQ